MNEDFSEARITRVMETYECSYEDAVRYLELRAEGYNYVEAQLMSGISDPDSVKS